MKMIGFLILKSYFFLIVITFRIISLRKGAARLWKLKSRTRSTSSNWSTEMCRKVATIQLMTVKYYLSISSYDVYLKSAILRHILGMHTGCIVPWNASNMPKSMGKHKTRSHMGGLGSVKLFEMSSCSQISHLNLRRKQYPIILTIARFTWLGINKRKEGDQFCAPLVEEGPCWGRRPNRLHKKAFQTVGQQGNLIRVESSEPKKSSQQVILFFPLNKIG